MASRANTTLDIDTISKKTMYNKNHYLSSGISYIPVISTSVNQSFLKCDRYFGVPKWTQNHDLLQT